MKRAYTLKLLITLTLIASALSCVVTALVFLIGFDAFGGGFKYVREYSSFLKEVDRLYIGDYDRGEIHDAALAAAAEEIGDRWSYYLNAEEYAAYLDYSSNSYAGIGVGVEVDSETGGMKILYVYKNSAAEKAGILTGDIIIKIDGTDISGMSLDEMKTLMTREIGKTIDLTLKRADGTEETVKAEYSYVFTPPVSYELLDGGIGYIELFNFAQGSAKSFIEAVEDLLEQGAAGFVFDVRNNGGGRVNEMTAMLDYLLPEGEIFIAVTKKGKENVTESDEAHVDIPAVVLVNRYSYSAAEYFAATLSEYGYARTVGEQTTGKNRSQVTVKLPLGGALHISSGEYLTKKRVSLHDAGGFTPEFEVELSEEDFAKNVSGTLKKPDDAQLNKAVSLLKTLPPD